MREEGFSLVELVVVIAIMGVLMVILTPQYLKYVEKSKLQKDNSAIGEIAESIKSTCSEDKVAEWVSSQTAPVEFRMSGGAGEDKTLTLSGTSSNLLEKELVTVLDTGYRTTSSSYRTSGQEIVFRVDPAGGAYMVTVDGIIEAPGQGATSKQF